VGKPVAFIAQQVGIAVPPEARILIVELKGVGRDYPLSIEKLCPVLSYYVVADWREGCERCIQILRYGGMGHTMSIHSRDEKVILEFGLKKPAYRIVVNTPTTHGSIGLTTGLDPAMTLGCGGYGGNITSDNISPRHLLNIKRLAYELRPAVGSVPASPRSAANTPVPTPTASAPPLPKAPPALVTNEVDASAVREQLASYLTSRGGPGKASAVVASGPEPPAAPTPAEFVCEEDVRQAVKQGRKIVIGEKTIVTPAARDLANDHKIFVQAGWRGN
jgi:acetaldehyde dehydrogenase (acetylating)